MNPAPLRPTSLIDRSIADEVREALLNHYDRSARALPWRGETDPYRVLVSEVMLQQTRVETVKRYYGPWLERFPNVASLAVAGEEEVLKAWEGLGYYRRARNLQAAARVVRERRDGALPSTHNELRGLPGVGEYTAGAVASIAFGEVRPAVDGNVRRVLSRLLDVADPSAAWLRETATVLVDPERPGDWNQALMELGATVCTPRDPECRTCPLRGWCAARGAGTQLDRPGPRRKRPVPTAHYAVGVFHSDGRALLVKRPAEGLLAGMWAFPECRLEAGRTTTGREVERMADELGLSTSTAPIPLPRCEHRFTHLRAVYLACSVSVRAGTEPDGPRRAWIDPCHDGGLAIPVAQRRILESWAAQMGRARPSKGEVS
jgi:A/G-specific adenine glycosylase